MFGSTNKHDIAELGWVLMPALNGIPVKIVFKLFLKTFLEDQIFHGFGQTAKRLIA